MCRGGWAAADRGFETACGAYIPRIVNTAAVRGPGDLGGGGGGLRVDRQVLGQLLEHGAGVARLHVENKLPVKPLGVHGLQRIHQLSSVQASGAGREHDVTHGAVVHEIDENA